jgi:hypothetical protein
MSDNYAFINKKVTFSSSYCKNSYLNNFDTFDSKAAYLCKSAPLSSATIASLAEETIANFTTEIEQSILEIKELTQKLKTVIDDTGCTISQYDESVHTDYQAKVRCHVSFLYLDYILETDELVPFIETLYLTGGMDSVQRNKMLRNLRNKMYHFRNEIETSSDKVRRSYKDVKAKSATKIKPKTKKPSKASSLMKVEAPKLVNA